MKKKTDSQPRNKSSKVKERDKKGRYAKGHKGGPGRKPGTIKDITCADGKKRSVAALVDDLLAAYATMGGGEFLAKWATANHRNLTKFIDILYKFAPMPAVTDSREFKPLSITILKQSIKGYKESEPNRLGTSSQAHQALVDQILELQRQMRAKDMELLRFKGIFQDRGIDPGELDHEPIIDALPVHDEDEEDHSDRRDK